MNVEEQFKAFGSAVSKVKLWVNEAEVWSLGNEVLFSFGGNVYSDVWASDGGELVLVGENSLVSLHFFYDGQSLVIIGREVPHIKQIAP